MEVVAEAVTAAVGMVVVDFTVAATMEEDIVQGAIVFIAVLAVVRT